MADNGQFVPLTIDRSTNNSEMTFCQIQPKPLTSAWLFPPRSDAADITLAPRDALIGGYTPCRIWTEIDGTESYFQICKCKELLNL